MRLICPNCDAQYEVPTEVIPEGGRDVQCSNCGDTWFQTHPDQEGAPAPDVEAAEPIPPAADEVEAEVSQPVEDTTEESFAAEPTIVPPEEEYEEEYEEDEPASIVAEPVARELDPAVVEVLKQEAEHEAQQRLNEQSSGLEIQPDLGLLEAEDDAGRRAREAREHMPKMPSDTPDGTDAAIAETLASRRDLLPDVEEINSSLRSDSGGDVDSYLEPEAEKRGFGRGFSMMILLAVILAGAYIMAPKITQTVPAAGPVISNYVAFVDKGRDALDARVKGVLDWLDAKASSSVP